MRVVVKQIFIVLALALLLTACRTPQTTAPTPTAPAASVASPTAPAAAKAVSPAPTTPATAPTVQSTTPAVGAPKAATMPAASPATTAAAPKVATATTTAATRPAATKAEPGRVVVPPPDAASQRLQVPQGFAVRLFYQGLRQPRLMTIGPDGVLYVAERGEGAVIRLPDANGDGLADERQVLATGFNVLHSLEWHEGWLYVATGSAIERLRDADNDGRFETREVVTNNIPGPQGHVTRTLHFGPDGKLYVTAGSSSNNTPESDPRRAAMMRFNPDGSIPDDNPFVADPDPRRRAVWAEGLRNAIDFLFLPDGRLWANHNGSDGLGDAVPPEEIVIQVEKGKHYGWPYCYTPAQGAVSPGANEVRDTRVPFGSRLTNCNQAVAALFTDLAHYAPIGMDLYDGTTFPAAYRGALLVAYHGSWNSNVPRDCRVQMIRLRDGAPVASDPFLTGFRDNDGQACGAAWGRPAGVTVGSQGELFVSDDRNGNVYRIVYVGG